MVMPASDTATLTSIEQLWVTNPVTVSLTIAQLESLDLVHPSARIQIVDGGAVSLAGITMPAAYVTLSDDGNSIDLTSVVTSASTTVHGGAAADAMLGSDTQADHLHGGEGNDVLDGQGGDDDMQGGQGDDTYYV